MHFTLKDNESEARERLRAFWAGESLGRPALHVTARNPGFRKAPWPRPALSLKERDLLPEYWAWQAEQTLSSTLYLAEAMPGFTVRWGSLLTTVAMLAGGDYEYNETGSGWILPRPGLYDLPLPRFDPQGPMTQAMEACLRAAAEAVGPRGYVNPPVMLDGLTTLSLFRTPEQLCLDVLERPADVRAWSAALTDIYLEAYDHFHRLLLGLGHRDRSTWLSAMAEGPCEAVQCDFAVMLSPAQFARLALPDLERLTAYLHCSLYHLDGTCQMRFLDLLRTLPRLSGIQWNPEPPAGSPTRWLEALREIRRRGFCLHVWCETVEEAVVLTLELGPDGLLLVLPQFETVNEAEAAIAKIQKA